MQRAGLDRADPCVRIRRRLEDQGDQYHPHGVGAGGHFGGLQVDAPVDGVTRRQHDSAPQKMTPLVKWKAHWRRLTSCAAIEELGGLVLCRAVLLL